jgi:hypothetical protein
MSDKFRFTLQHIPPSSHRRRATTTNLRLIIPNFVGSKHLAHARSTLFVAAAATIKKTKKKISRKISIFINF